MTECCRPIGIKGEMSKTEPDILQKAAEVIADRERLYGSPNQNHIRIANLWPVFLEKNITAKQVAVCMVLVKIARLMETPDHLDSLVDVAGYAAVYEQMDV